MTLSVSSSDRILSRGWREVWLYRTSIALLAFLAASYCVYLFGWPWQDEFAIYPLATEGAFLLLVWIAMENLRPRWISVASGIVTIGYLSGPQQFPSNRLRKADLRSPIRTRVVAYEDTQLPSAFGRRYHWVTWEQSRAISACS